MGVCGVHSPLPGWHSPALRCLVSPVPRHGGHRRLQPQLCRACWGAADKSQCKPGRAAEQVRALCCACVGTLWLLGLRNKPGAKGQEVLAAAASLGCTVPAARGLSPAGHVYQDIL